MSEQLRQHLLEGERAGQRYALGLPRRVPRGAAGPAAGRRVGSSLEFQEYRDYQPGDDLRHIDWNAYARSDELSVKLFREELTPHADLIVDASRSMVLENSAKGQATLGLAAFFAAASANAGYTHSAWLVGADLRPVPRGTEPPGAWEAIDFDTRGEPAGLLGPAPWRPRGVRVLLSDLLWEAEPLAVMRPLAGGAAATVVVQVLAAADADPEEGSLRLVDVETDRVREIHVDAAVLRRYQAALARHQENWSQACRQVGAVFTTVVAERLLRDWRLDELVAAEVLRVA
jgi:uncharacterized protein (DUF58 family)